MLISSNSYFEYVFLSSIFIIYTSNYLKLIKEKAKNSDFISYKIQSFYFHYLYEAEFGNTNVLIFSEKSVEPQIPFPDFFNLHIPQKQEQIY